MIRLNRVFSDLESFEYEDEDLDLDCSLVPLRGPWGPLIERGLVVRCPSCNLVMVYIGNGSVMCPECGLLG